MYEDKNFNLFVVIFLSLICQFPTIGFECGRSKHSEGFIIGGTFLNRGDYPWIAALVNFNTQKFFCGASLITNSHVVTAAHCINPKNTQQTLSSKDIAVLLGKHNLNFTVEKGSVTVYLEKIHIHPDWRYYTDDYDGDIAILKFKHRVTFSDYIFPICWPSRASIEEIFEGVVVGWGKSENEDKTHEEIPKEVLVKSIPNEKCFLDDYQFARISSKRTFCAGADNAGPCNGDSGGGLFVNKNGISIIRGIVSASFVEKGECDVTKYAIYTNVIKFTDWSREILGQTIITRSELDEIIEPDNDEYIDHHITIDCNYIDGLNIHAIPVKSLYSCFVNKFDVPQRNSIAHIHGKHREGFSNQDVQEFHMELKAEFPYIPMGIGKIFPNLELFFIGQGSLKYVERKNFEGMSKVSSLFLGYNDLIDIPRDAFFDLFNLEALFIDNNKIKSLHRDLLITMPKLKKFIAYNNQIEYLDAGIFRRNFQLKYITLFNNQLKTIGVNFKQLKDIGFVSLKQNLCIDVEFTEGSSIVQFQDLVSKNC